MKLNLGCGKDIRKGYINLDSVRLQGVDKFHNLDKFPYPFKDNTFTEIYCSHILEHIEDLVKVMEELYRISKADAKIIIKAPYFTNPGAFSDPTHRHFFTYNTMDYFSSESGLNYYSKSRFNIVEKKIKLISTKNVLLRIFVAIPELFINLFPNVYQRFFPYIIPASEIVYILKTLK